MPEYSKRAVRRGRISRRRFKRRSKYKANKAPLYYHVTIMPGIFLKRASRGVDSTGDTPGSYEHFNVSVYLIGIYRL